MSTEETKKKTPPKRVRMEQFTIRIPELHFEIMRQISDSTGQSMNKVAQVLIQKGIDHTC